VEIQFEDDLIRFEESGEDLKLKKEVECKDLVMVRN
jgi:hypothetical protein